MNELKLIRTENFGDITCDVYAAGSDFWMTREQIGRALGYSNPQKAIDNLHQRHRERLSKFSVTLKVRATDGKTYLTTVYSAKGIYEICRWSQQPKANAFYDWVYSLLEGLRTGRLTIKNAALDEYLAMSEEDRAIAYFTERKKVKQLEPKAESFDQFMAGKNAQTMSVVAKSLGTGSIRLFRFLRAKGVLMNNNLPYQQYLERGYFRVVEKAIPMGEKVMNKPQTLVTPKGVDYISRLYRGVS